METVFVFKPQAFFKSVSIEGVHDKRDTLSDERARIRVDFNLSSIRYLFDAGDN
jgi:hypothetical protein